jgi:hypothetical protein
MARLAISKLDAFHLDRPARLEVDQRLTNG